MRRSNATRLAHQVQHYRAEAIRRDQIRSLLQVEIIWRDPQGNIQHKFMPWRRPATYMDLADWIEEYLTLVAEGYTPEGFEQAPLPHCCRIIDRGGVMAEWHSRPSFSAESPVTADEREGSGGIPTAPPSAPCSLRLAVPTQQAPCPSGDSGLPEEDPSNVAGLGQGHSVA